MSHIQYTIVRSGRFYYNRRVPKHAVSTWGQFIRVGLTDCPSDAAVFAERLTAALDAAWKNPVPGQRFDLDELIAICRPRSLMLRDFCHEYLQLRDMRSQPTLLAVEGFIAVVGHRSVEDYGREDARLYVQHLQRKGNKTATIRRRINSISAVLNYAYAELDADKRNPFSRLMIKGEGADVSKRGTFTKEQLRQGYTEALSSGNSLWLLMPILGETGCRLGEIVGLRVEDVDLEQDVIHIRPHALRRLKTTGSERSLPLVGHARTAIRQVMEQSEHGVLFPRYLRPEGMKTDHASCALSKWLKNRFGSLTAHCLRHTMRDRLREVEAPVELIDQIGGWSSSKTVGSSYGKGFATEHLRTWLDQVAL